MLMLHIIKGKHYLWWLISIGSDNKPSMHIKSRNKTRGADCGKRKWCTKYLSIWQMVCFSYRIWLFACFPRIPRLLILSFLHDGVHSKFGCSSHLIQSHNTNSVHLESVIIKKFYAYIWYQFRISSGIKRYYYESLASFILYHTHKTMSVTCLKYQITHESCLC